jgi:hypothetical protein
MIFLLVVCDASLVMGAELLIYSKKLCCFALLPYSSSKSDAIIKYEKVYMTANAGGKYIC